MSGSQGVEGESLALRFLIDLGYRLIERNYWTRTGEIDLIVQKDSFLIFVEVKSWTSIDISELGYSVDQRKINRIIRVAKSYIAGNKQFEDLFFRFDVIYIDRTGKIYHIEDAFAETNR